MTDVSTTKGIVPYGEPEMKGWLFKWTNYLKGYQRRWFVLQNGFLSYYRGWHEKYAIVKRDSVLRAENYGGPKLSIRRRRRHHRNGNQAEMAHTCRGNISLHGALIHTVDNCTFVISNGGTQTFHIKANSEVERTSWVTALELAKVKAIRSMESEEDEEDGAGDAATSNEELNTVVKELHARLEDMQMCSELIAKHGATLQRLLGELEQQPLPSPPPPVQQPTSVSSSATPGDSMSGPQTVELDSKAKAVGERATLFRIASNAMINACSEYLAVAKTQGHKWLRVLQHEREQRQRLEDMVEQLARQHSHLEMAANAHATGAGGPGPVVSPSDDDEENEFYDCDNEAAASAGVTTSSTNNCSKDNSFVMNIPMTGSAVVQNYHHHHRRRDSSDSSGNEDNAQESRQVLFVTSSAAPQQQQQNQQQLNIINNSMAVSKRTRRVSVPEKPNYPLNLWSIMKNCIGKDLSKIPMPVNFSEPLSMLQRLTEDYEYADILDVAAGCKDPCEQLAYVAAFTVSSYSTTSIRTGKPFNPLLGETYECDRRDDLGWRSISEQVSHHPPMVAQYCEGAKWRCWQEFTMTSKFRGKYLQVIPMGTAHVEFTETGNRYSWRKVTTTVHNIIVGKLWVDHHGDMEIAGKAGPATGITCHLKYIPYSYFTRDQQRRVKGYVMDANKMVRWAVTGTWDNKVDIAPVTGPTESLERSASTDFVFQTGPAINAWQRRPPPANADKQYGFTILAAQLNEPEDGVAPTDSRLRPDQRLMENGQWDEANKEKVRLEEKQRAARRRRECEVEEAARSGSAYPSYEPLWFVKRKEDDSDAITHVYKNTYWQCKERGDWSQCPDIF